MISKEEALRLIENTSKYSHALVVSAIMRKLAEKLGENKDKWEIVGLLHDLDYDQTRNDMSKHGIIASQILKGKLPEDCLYAIKSHDYRTGFKPKSKLDKALIIADSLAILLEKIERSEELSIKKLNEEILNISKDKPWIKDNLRKTEEIGLEINEVLELAAEMFKAEEFRNLKVIQKPTPAKTL